GHAEIEIRAGWREPLHLYTATIANSGERKSAVQQSMVAPIFDVEADLVSKGVDERMEAEARKQVATKAAERARNAAASASRENRDEAMTKAVESAAFAESIEVPPI